MLLLSILPSIILLVVVWKGDRYEKEPPGLLIKLFLLGSLTTISAFIIEFLFENVILSFMNQQGILFALIDNFLVVAVAEEAGKYFVLKKVTWKHPAFNFTFDAVVYAVAVSLGFATLENILYLIDGSVFLALSRALFSVPGHFIDALYMGYYYGLARFADAYNDDRLKKVNLKLAFWVPVLIHGFYDFCLSTEYGIFILVFLIFEAVLTFFAVRKFLKLSKIVAPIPGSSYSEMASPAGAVSTAGPVSPAGAISASPAGAVVPGAPAAQPVEPVIRASICNGEQVAGFRDTRTGRFEEVMYIRNQSDLEAFKAEYGIVGEIKKEY